MMSLFKFIILIFGCNALHFQYSTNNGPDTKILMDKCDNNWIAGLHLSESAQCKLSTDNGGYYGVATFEDLQRVIMIHETALVNVSLKLDSSIQLVLPPGNYEIIVNKDISMMHIYSLQKMQQIKVFHNNALSVLGDEYMLIKKCQIQKSLSMQQSMGKISKAINKEFDETKSKSKFVWTEKDKQIMKAQAENFEELAAMHSSAAALYETKEKRFFV